MDTNPRDVEGFVAYASACSVDDPRLYCHLVAIGREHDDARKQMIEQAMRFVQGHAPYEGQQAHDAAAIGPEFAALAKFAVIATRMQAPTVQQLRDLLADLFGHPWSDASKTLGSEAFALQLDRAWQNVFALHCLSDASHASLAELTRAIVVGKLLQRIAQSADMESPEIDWSTRRLHDGLHATLVLPEEIFPLPSALP